MRQLLSFHYNSIDNPDLCGQAMLQLDRPIAITSTDPFVELIYARPEFYHYPTGC